MAEVVENVMEELSISIDEVPSLAILLDTMMSTEHGRQHGVFVFCQRAQTCSEVCTSDIELDDGWKLEKEQGSSKQAAGDKGVLVITNRLCLSTMHTSTRTCNSMYRLVQGNWFSDVAGCT